MTGDNWEGRGVAPDLPCPAAQALAVAHHRAREEVRERLCALLAAQWRARA